MYTLDRKFMFRLALYHLTTAIFCAVFGAVYEMFSHGVYSFFMIYAFLIPLVLGTLVFMILGMRLNDDGVFTDEKNLDRACVPDIRSIRFWISGTVVLTLGCLMKGVLEIYGTTNRLLIVYPVAGGILLVLGIIFYHKQKRILSA